ncbi:hypothetical protein CYFUS_008344 [Cystobacter fuscus]|uniref:Uncharacterized protein n=1 Tax=Cystobacter fuscus TaxID=43 RepID=A0A250JG40_9BACT|nr:hypothetical protein [Cystobacter fuscus]ATB42865.1 hypothetical protein CYFUS_008344 [Cystobacter fuscus]
MKATHLLSALCVLLPALAWSAPTHSIWSTQGYYLNVPGVSTTVSSANMSFNWTEGTGLAFVNAQAKVPSGDLYAFQLVSVTAPTTADEIVGLWNVSKNGAPLCTGCAGSAYGLSLPLNSYFKIYVGNYSYHLSGFITNRYDY